MNSYILAFFKFISQTYYTIHYTSESSSFLYQIIQSQNTQVDVSSAGRVRLRSADPFAPPSIQPNLFGDERDVEVLLDGHKFLRTVFATEPMSRYVIEEQSPGREVRSDDEWRAFIRETGIGVYHPAGTCKMGHDRMAVVDDRLRVHGLEGLYVVDASIMPFVVSANLNGNCIMIGEKASDMIRSAP